jgi:hypothetical protein
MSAAPDLVASIRKARETVVRLEAETSESGHLLRLSKEKLRRARAELDTLLAELCNGQSRYPLFPEVQPGNGATPEPTIADEVPVRPALSGRVRRTKGEPQ